MYTVIQITMTRHLSVTIETRRTIRWNLLWGGGFVENGLAERTRHVDDVLSPVCAWRRFLRADARPHSIPNRVVFFVLVRDAVAEPIAQR